MVEAETSGEVIMWGKPYKLQYKSGNFRWISECLRLPSGDLVSFNLAVIVTRAEK